MGVGMAAISRFAGAAASRLEGGHSYPGRRPLSSIPIGIPGRLGEISAFRAVRGYRDSGSGGAAAPCGKLLPMCRSIKTLRRADEPATQREIEEAALQYVRKVSGYRMPSRRNAEAFDAAVREVASASRRLLDAVSAPAGDRAG